MPPPSLDALMDHAGPRGGPKGSLTANQRGEWVGVLVPEPTPPSSDRWPSRPTHKRPIAKILTGSPSLLPQQEDGQRWDRGFMGGLAGSMVFVPVVSAGALRPMVGLGTRGEDPDYMLVEWAAALELQQRGRLKAVFPLFAAVTDNFFGEASAAFGGIAGLPDRVPESSLEKVSFHLAETTGDSSTAKLRALMCETGQTVVVGEPSVRQIIATILKYQGCKLSYADSESVELFVSRLHGVVEGCMHRVGAKKEGELNLGDPVSPGTT